MLCAHHGSFAIFGVITEHSFIFVFSIEKHFLFSTFRGAMNLR